MQLCVFAAGAGKRTVKSTSPEIETVERVLTYTFVYMVFQILPGCCFSTVFFQSESKHWGAPTPQVCHQGFITLWCVVLSDCVGIKIERGPWHGTARVKAVLYLQWNWTCLKWNTVEYLFIYAPCPTSPRETGNGSDQKKKKHSTTTMTNDQLVQNEWFGGSTCRARLGISPHVSPTKWFVKEYLTQTRCEPPLLSDEKSV